MFIINLSGREVIVPNQDGEDYILPKGKEAKVLFDPNTASVGGHQKISHLPTRKTGYTFLLNENVAKQAIINKNPNSIITFK